MESKLDIQHGRFFFYGIFTLLTVGVFWLLKDYWQEILLAFTTGIVLHPYYEFLKRRFKLRNGIANFIVLLSAFLFIFLPLTSVGLMLLKDALSIQARFGQNINLADLNMENLVDQINRYLAFIPFSSYSVDIEQLQTAINNGLNFITTFIINNLSGVLGSFTGILLSIIIYFTILFFIIPNFKNISEYVKDLSPMSRSIDEQFLGKARAMIIDMLKGTVVIGVVQSIIAGITLSVFGMDYILTLTVVMIILSFIPVVGTAFVMVPIGLLMLLTGNTIAGVVILLVQMIVIANVDNVLRPMLVSDKAKINPVLVILSVIGGLKVMGMLGVIYGPVIMILFVTAVEIYKKYYR